MEKIKEFLSIRTISKIGHGHGSDSGYGSGYGSGTGNGYGNGDGYGYGSGSGYGTGSGSGSGNGSGSGSGTGNGYGNDDGYGYGSGSGYGYYNSDITKFNGNEVFLIDGVSTIITNIKNNIAIGFILQLDFTLTPCYIVKENNVFSHGTTLREAINSLQEKLYNNYPLKERILKFKEKFKDYSLKYAAEEFFIWHNILTGSCKMGRMSFAKDKNINLETDTFTVYEFINLTKDQYNGANIKALLD